MKQEKQYTKEEKKSALMRLMQGESKSRLSKELGVSKNRLMEWYGEVEFKWNKPNHNPNGCGKEYPFYQAVVEKQKGSPYASKLGGIPYIPKGETWVKCPKCGVEKVLIVQLNVSELPDVSDALREWDFVQVFACMKPSEVLLEDVDGYDDASYYYYHGEIEKARELAFSTKRHAYNQCYNIIERPPRYDEVYDELFDGKNMHVGGLFNDYFDIQLVKKEQEAQSFVYPPWMDGYGLQYDQEGCKVVSNFHNDKRDYSWVEGHYLFEKVISSWVKAEDTNIPCDRHFEHIDMCSNEYYSGSSDLLGMLHWDRLDDLQYAVESGEEIDGLKCPECGESLSLLFQFKVPRDNVELQLLSEYSFNSFEYALFYCEKHPEWMSCHYVFHDH